MGTWQPYVVRTGDHLERIAHERSADAQAIWDHPSNAKLKSLRTNYNVLLCGDVLYLPPAGRPFLPVKVGQNNTFVGSLPTCSVSHTFVADGQPLANLALRIFGAGPPIDSTTDADGRVTFDVPVTAREVLIVFTGGRSFRLAIGHLDPANSPTGCIQRLQHLNYLGPKDPVTLAEPHSDAWVACALGAFQKDAGLPVTGILDDATSAELQKAYGA